MFISKLLGTIGLLVVASVFCDGTSLYGQPYDVSWYTLDNGGGTVSAANFELTATIGQPDAGPVLNGGLYVVTGGFWTIQESSVLLGDVNGDGTVDLLDVAPFVQAISDGDFIPAADINGDGSVDLLDVAPFIELLSG